jgi:hypothetical protein
MRVIFCSSCRGNPVVAFVDIHRIILFIIPFPIHFIILFLIHLSHRAVVLVALHSTFGLRCPIPARSPFGPGQRGCARFLFGRHQLLSLSCCLSAPRTSEFNQQHLHLDTICSALLCCGLRVALPLSSSSAHSPPFLLQQPCPALDQ